LTDRFKRSIRRLWQDSLLPVIADASALDWLPDGPCVPGVLRVMTPHPGEAARLLQSSVAEVQRDRVASVRELSRRWGNCCVVLKGHQTLVGRDREEIYVTNSGNPHLAQGGSGDLLAGYLGGLLAQPELQRDALFTVRFAVWQHGAAAESLLARKPNFIIEELADELGLVRP
jgi:NAD(P)H-hydrate epimerase